MEEFVDVLHLRDWVFGVADDYDLVVLGGEDPFDGSDLVELCDFFFYIYHI